MREGTKGFGLGHGTTKPFVESCLVKIDVALKFDPLITSINRATK